MIRFEGDSGATDHAGQGEALGDEGGHHYRRGQYEYERALAQQGAVVRHDGDGQSRSQRNDTPRARPGQHGRDAPGGAYARVPLDDGREGQDPQQANGDQGRGDRQRVQRPEPVGGGQRGDLSGQGEADQAEDDALQQEDHGAVDGVQLDPYAGIAEPVRPSSEHHARHDNGGHAGRVHRFGQHVGGVRGHQGDDGLQYGVLGPAADQRHDPGDRSSDEGAAPGEQRELSARRLPGHPGGGRGDDDRDPEEHERRGVVEEALGLHEDLDTGRQGKAPTERSDRHRVRTREDGPQDQRHLPSQRGEQRRDQTHRGRRGQDQTDREHADRLPHQAQFAPGQFLGAGVQQGRKNDEPDGFGADPDHRSARHQRDGEARDNEQ